jgi:O-antigen ligase
MLKFGNPPIMERWVEPPGNAYEFILGTPWPIAWAHFLLGSIALIGVFIAFRLPRMPSGVPRWLLFLPLLWLGWQFLATFQSLSLQLSVPTFRHFVACAACFYLGFYVLSRSSMPDLFWVGLFCAFSLVLLVGWEQHFGGLQATREYFFREIYPQLKEVPPEYLKKMTSNRIFSTLFYPNALAGALLLLLPPTLAIVASSRNLLTVPARCFLCGAISLGALACLYWSGSKGGWLLMLLLALVALLRLKYARTYKVMLVCIVLLVGLAGFAWRYASFFQKGATSVSARFDYWRAALSTAVSHPWLGTGPGTFMIPYGQIKRPESEMTRMVHNDYLEQASDSGWIGFLLYAAFVGVTLFHVGRPFFASAKSIHPDSAESNWVAFSVWLGLLGWSVQGLFEFGLYIPGLAWSSFTLLGLLLARIPKPIDKPHPYR